MARWLARLASVVLSAGLAACGLLEARYHQPPLPVVDAWPIPPQANEGVTADIGWRDFFTDDKLRRLLGLALANNRDLRVAVLTVDKARAAYRVQRSYRLPEIDATGAATKERIAPVEFGLPPSAGGQTTKFYSASLGVTNFELDLFGRVASLSHAALQQYFAESEARRAAQLSLIAEVANAYLTLAADLEHERIGEQTLQSQDASYRLIEKRYSLGAASSLELSQARTTVESARWDAAHYAGAVAVDKDALMVLVGVPIDEALLPTAFEPEVSGVAPLPAGLPSTVLLRRPDVLQAEHVLRSADASIGAARAAFFPTISLTGSVGSVSTDLSGLFKSGSGTWKFAPQLNVPIFAAGRANANLRSAKADRDIAIARYEQAIQTSFREVADALALTATLRRQSEANRALVEASDAAFKLSEARYKSGKDGYLQFLDAQRSDYAARQGLIGTLMSEQSNRITLYKALGGGWIEGRL
jgi:multidrug efflux system outer membrane protein